MKARACAFLDQLLADALASVAGSAASEGGSCHRGCRGLSAREAPREVLLVSHGGFIKVLLRDVFRLPGVVGVNNTSISTVDVVLPRGAKAKAGAVVFASVCLNDCDHLLGAGLMSESTC